MNPGPIEETGKVATGVIDALKSSPALLGIIVLNGLIFGMLYFVAKENRSRQHELTQLLLENQIKMQEMLVHCRDVPRTELFTPPPG